MLPLREGGLHGYTAKFVQLTYTRHHAESASNGGEYGDKEFEYFFPVFHLCYLLFTIYYLLFIYNLVILRFSFHRGFFVSHRSHESHEARIAYSRVPSGMLTLGIADKLRELLSMQPFCEIREICVRLKSARAGGEAPYASTILLNEIFCAISLLSSTSGRKLMW